MTSADRKADLLAARKRIRDRAAAAVRRAALPADARIERVVEGYAYPKSGSAHTTTPRVRWDLYWRGELDGSFARKRDAVAAAHELGRL